MRGWRFGFEELAEAGIEIAGGVGVGSWRVGIGIWLGLGFIGTPEPAHGACCRLGDC